MGKFTQEEIKFLEETIELKTADGRIRIRNVYNDIDGNVLGSVGGDISGHVGGSVMGNVLCDVGGNVWGDDECNVILKRLFK